MPTTYAAYSNLHAANLAAEASTSAATSMPNSQRNSVSSATSETGKKSRWQRFLDELKPIEQPLPPVGFFSPIPPYPPKEKKASTSSEKKEDSPSRRASRAFEHFKSIAGEKHSIYARA